MITESYCKEEFREQAVPKIVHAYNLKAEDGYTERIGVLECQNVRPFLTKEDMKDKKNRKKAQKKPGKPVATDLEDKYERSEFVDEHEGRTAWLHSKIRLWMIYLPWVGYHRHHNEHSVAWGFTDADWFLMECQKSLASLAMEQAFLLEHDTGEIKNGDVPADGRPEYAEHIAAETEVMEEVFAADPPELVPMFRTMRQNFESFRADGGAMKVCDKVEALMFLLFLESKGHIGHTILRPHPSDGDLKACEILGTDVNTDVWCLRFRIQTKSLPEAVTGPYVDVLTAQFQKVRGEIPLCMTMDVRGVTID